MLDFSKVNKRFLVVQLTDGSKLMIRMPTKKIYDTLIKLQDAMTIVDNAGTDSEDAMEALDMVYGLTSEIMSNNLGGKKVTEEYLAGIFDVEDIQIFFLSYMEFVTGKIVSDPN